MHFIKKHALSITTQISLILHWWLQSVLNGNLDLDNLGFESFIYILPIVIATYAAATT